jgi:hypothetical protein
MLLTLSKCCSPLPLNKRKKQIGHRGAVKPPEENPRKRHCSHSRSLPMNAFDQKDEYRQKSIVKPTGTQDDTCNTSMKRPVSSPSVKAPPIAMAPILSSRGRKKELHGLATLAQNFRNVVTVSSSILQCYILFACILLTCLPNPIEFWQPRY